jgi:DUF1365 family protein
MDGQPAEVCQPEVQAPQNGIYRGRIVHHRFLPKKHLFTYPVFIFSIDLDTVAQEGRRLRLFGHNRFSLYTLRDSDHGGSPVGGDPERAIKENVIALLRERGFHGAVDQIFMVTEFRVLGYLFNPVTFYYCFAEGREVAWVAEVNNTFHQRHSYVFYGEGEPSSAPGKIFRTDKVFYVSPFLEMDLVYTFRFEPLGSKLGVFIDDLRPGARTDEPEAMMLKTLIVGRHEPLTDRGLLFSFLRIPWMSAWIIGWIHWQALKLWLKKIPVVFRPKDGMKPGWKEG